MASRPDDWPRSRSGPPTQVAGQAEQNHSNISEANEITGSQLGSQRCQILGYVRPQSASVGAAKRHVRPHLASSGDGSSVPSKQRVAGSNPARRAQQTPRPAVNSACLCVIITKHSALACPMGPNCGASDYPPRARSERQRWPAGAHQLRAGRPSRPGLSRRRLRRRWPGVSAALCRWCGPPGARRAILQQRADGTLTSASPVLRVVVFSAFDCPARGRRVNGDSAGRRFVMASPSLTQQPLTRIRRSGTGRSPTFILPG